VREQWLRREERRDSSDVGVDVELCTLRAPSRAAVAAALLPCSRALPLCAHSSATVCCQYSASCLCYLPEFNAFMQNAPGNGKNVPHCNAVSVSAVCIMFRVTPLASWLSYLSNSSGGSDPMVASRTSGGSDFMVASRT
jgi:hypothetical protein